MESLRFPVYKITSSMNRDYFTSSFSIWMPFISFSCLIALARTSDMLNRNGQNSYLCLVPNLRGKTFSFFTIEYCVSCWLFINESDFLLSLLSVFIMKRYLSCQMLSLHLLTLCFVLYLVFVLWLIFACCSVSHSRIKFHVVMVHNHFNVLLKSAC